MSNVNFYEVNSSNYDVVICKLLLKCYESKKNTLVIFENNEKMEQIDKTLWSYTQKEFIPHATMHDLYPQKQPILLSTEYNNINNSKILVLISSNIKTEEIENFEKSIFIFNGLEENTDKFKNLFDGIDIKSKNYYKQNAKGLWEECYI